MLIFQSLQSCFTNDHPTHTLHPTEGNCLTFSYQGRTGTCFFTSCHYQSYLHSTSQSCHTYLPPTLFTAIPVSSVLHHVALLLLLTQQNTPTAPHGISPWVVNLSMLWLHAFPQKPTMMLLVYFIWFICSSVKMWTCNDIQNMKVKYFQVWSHFSTTNMPDNHHCFLSSTN